MSYQIAKNFSITNETLNELNEKVIDTIIEDSRAPHFNDLHFRKELHQIWQDFYSPDCAGGMTGDEFYEKYIQPVLDLDRSVFDSAYEIGSDLWEDEDLYEALDGLFTARRKIERGNKRLNDCYFIRHELKKNPNAIIPAEKMKYVTSKRCLLKVGFKTP